MQILPRPDVERLVRSGSGTRVSIYLPTHRVTCGDREDRIRLKNLVRDAEARLAARGTDAAVSEAILRPVRRLLEDPAFWRYQGDGLALLADARTFRAYRLPVAFREVVVVDDRFHVKPLLRYFIAEGRFLLLVLSQGSVRLLQGTRHGVESVEYDGPTSLIEALWHDDPQRQLQMHSVGGPTGPGGGAGGTIWHGQSVGDGDKDRVLRFFRKVADAVRHILHDDDAPLVLAGVSYLHPIYREADHAPRILDVGLVGNFDHTTDAELHARAWSLVCPHLERAMDEVVRRVRRREGTGRATTDLGAAVAAAATGRVDTLLVATDAERWGRFDASTETVETLPRDAPDACELLDLAVAETLRHGGDAHALPPERMPGDSPIAALLRY